MRSLSRSLAMASALVGLRMLAAGASYAQCDSTTALACGETKGASLATATTVDCYTFTAAAFEGVGMFRRGSLRG